MELDWGADVPPNPAAGDGTERVSAATGDLPEVRALEKAGWFLAPEAPAWVYLPAIWPAHARTWVPDRSTRYMSDGTTVSPWPEFMYASVESDYNLTLRAAGLPERPPGRLWLLRPPPGFATLEHVLEHVHGLARADDVDTSCCPEAVGFVSREIGRLFAVPG